MAPCSICKFFIIVVDVLPKLPLKIEKGAAVDELYKGFSLRNLDQTWRKHHPKYTTCHERGGVP